jgi:Plasmid pRiA4b ORF-3-like protein
MVPVPKQICVFEAVLVDFTETRRTIAIGSTQTLDDLHHTLRAAFEWDDEHLYSFWLKGGFWARNGSEYTHPFHAAQPNPLAPFATGRARKSADVRLDRLRLRRGQRLAYVHDFGDERRVAVTLRQITADDGGVYPRLLEQVGNAPPPVPRPRRRRARRMTPTPSVPRRPHFLA